MRKPYYPIIMGDLFESSKRETRTLSKVFNSIIRKTNNSYKKNLISPLTITLGDEFQGISKTLEKGFEIISSVNLNLKAKNLSCRFVLAFGEINTPINKRIAWNMLGEGLKMAREALNDKKCLSVYRFILPEPTLHLALNVIGESLTFIENSWTIRQREVVLQYMAVNENSMRICRRLDFSKANLYKILKSANYNLFKKLRETIMNILHTIEIKASG